MREEGTVSIIKRGETYNVRYASNNPLALEPQPRHCNSETQVVALLRQLGVDAWYITQACADIQKRGFAGLSVLLDTGKMHSMFHTPATVQAA